MSEQPPATTPYLTEIPDRAPLQKVHTDLGQAKKAILYRLSSERLTQPCKIYRWGKSGWELLWDIKEGTKREEMPWLVTASPKS